MNVRPSEKPFSDANVGSLARDLCDDVLPTLIFLDGTSVGSFWCLRVLDVLEATCAGGGAKRAWLKRSAVESGSGEESDVELSAKAASNGSSISKLRRKSPSV